MFLSQRCLALSQINKNINSSEDLKKKRKNATCCDVVTADTQVLLKIFQFKYVCMKKRSFREERPYSPENTTRQ